MEGRKKAASIPQDGCARRSALCPARSTPSGTRVSSPRRPATLIPPELPVPSGSPRSCVLAHTLTHTRHPLTSTLTHAPHTHGSEQTHNPDRDPERSVRLHWPVERIARSDDPRHPASAYSPCNIEALARIIISSHHSEKASCISLLFIIQTVVCAGFPNRGPTLRPTLRVHVSLYIEFLAGQWHAYCFLACHERSGSRAGAILVYSQHQSRARS